METINFRDFMNDDYKTKTLPSIGALSIGLIPTGSFFNMSPMMMGAYGIILTVGLGAIFINFLSDDVQEVFETLLKVVGTVAAVGFLIWLMSGGVLI